MEEIVDEGDRVELARDVERYPHFIAPKGSTGVVVRIGPEEVAVRLNDQLEGAEEWDNQVLWAGEHRSEFSADVSVVS